MIDCHFGLLCSRGLLEQDPYADASIGNVTGSNSVNVLRPQERAGHVMHEMCESQAREFLCFRFLGLGLPWTIGSCYWASVGRSAEWQKKYESEAANEGRLVAAKTRGARGLRTRLLAHP